MLSCNVLSESDFLLCKFSSVLLRNIESAEFTELLLFNGFNLDALVVDLLADLATLLQIVQAVLLALLVVCMDLSAQLIRVLLQHIFLLLFNAALLLLHFLLFVDNSKEFITFLFRLLGESLLSLKELSLASLFHVSKD